MMNRTASTVTHRVPLSCPRRQPGDGTCSKGDTVRFRVFIDGKVGGAVHGSDVDAQGQGTTSEQRTYQLIRQSGEIKDRTFEIEFLDPGVDAYGFTFG